MLTIKAKGVCALELMLCWETEMEDELLGSGKGRGWACLHSSHWALPSHVPRDHILVAGWGRPAPRLNH